MKYKNLLIYIKKILYNFNKNFLENENIINIFIKKYSKKYLFNENKNLKKIEIEELNKLLINILLGIPKPYIIKEKEFWSMKFEINNNIFIPRNETELLVEFILNNTNNNKKYNILDLGTGSGVIAISLSNEMYKSNILGIDINSESLKISKKNCKKLCINKNINFYYSNWFKNINNLFDVIVSNPPYISINEFHNSNYEILFDPINSLISKKNSIYEIKFIIKKSINFLKNNGILILEHGKLQGNSIRALFKKYNFSFVKTYLDYSKLERFTIGILK